MASSAGPRPTGLQAAIIAFSIRFRGVVIALGVLLLVYGVVSLLSAKYDVFPEFAPPQVSIQTEAPGLTPEQVEMLVTTPIETDVNGVPGIQKLVSTSIQGISIVKVFFNSGSNIYLDRQVVAERLAVAAQQLPKGVQAPAMTPLTSSTGIVLVGGLTSKRQSLMKLKTVAEWTIRPRLLAVPGVANVTVFGRDTRSLQIQVRPDQLVRYHLGMNDVLVAAQKATGVRGAGFIDTANQRILFQSEGQSLTPDELAQTVLLTHGAARLTLGDVANVVVAPEPPIGAAEVNGKPGVVFNVEEQYGANTANVTRGVETALADLAPGLKEQGIGLHANLFRPANFIDTAMANIRTSLYIGGSLVVIVLTLFLFDLRTAAIAVAAIPLSLLAGVIVLEKIGGTLNVMTLGGLAIAVGIVVDDAVIGVENIVRRLRENRQRAAPQPPVRVILEAAFEVRNPVVYATFAVLLVTVPILLLPGISGALFAPLGISYSLAVLASLVVAVTVVPALSMALLARRTETEPPPVVRWSRARYEALLRRISSRQRMVIALAAVFTILGCATLPLFGASFIPELHEGHYIIHMSAVPGTSIARSLQIGARVAEALRKIPQIRAVAQRVGRAELAGDVYGTHYSEIEVDLKPGLSGDDQEEVQAEIRQALSRFVGVNFSVKTFLSERIEETLSGYTAAVAVNIFGNDLDVLDQKAQEVARVLNGVPGAAEVTVQSPPGLPQLTIRLCKSALVRWGVDPTDVLDALRAAYAGDTVGQTYRGNQVFNVSLILSAKDRNSVSKIGDLPLRAPDGTLVPLRQLADIYEASGRYQIMHEGGQRVASVTFNIAGGSASAVVQAARARIASQVKLPAGAYIQLAGSFQAQAQAQQNLILNSVVVGVAIILLLSIVTRGWRNLLLILVNLPFALVGGVLAVFGTGGYLTLGSMIGFVTVFGITVRNSILIISHYEHLVEVEGLSWGLPTAIKGAGDRLTPILMTSLVTGLGLLPLAVGGGAPGQEIEGPMAIVILGGLLTSMVLNLLVLPTLALRYGRFEPIRISDDALGLEGRLAPSQPSPAE
ncbi:MAG: efflux RND transporter permease subunit [Hyphomicrobiales bacterium]|nr:efflux RND transporter permease subunit [Hyphomicrobiales bacterium]